MKTYANAVLVLAGLGFLAFGVWLLIDPIGGLGAVDITATSQAGLIELRGFYGGLEVGLGIFLLACASKPDWRQPGLWLVALGNGGIGITRVAGIITGGVFTPFFAYALVWELGFTAAALLALWWQRRA